MSEARCPICSNDSFCVGPNGRVSQHGLFPMCSKCGSLERHRAIRQEFNSISSSIRSDIALQFSNDASIDRSYFDFFEVSVFNGVNHLDLMDIDREDNYFSFVSCIHVLEHVEDDEKALRELIRVLARDGVLFLCVPSPENIDLTNDWGFPDWRQHGHYRVYGRDFLKKVSDVSRQCSATCEEKLLTDPVTGDITILYLVRKSI